MLPSHGGGPWFRVPVSNLRDKKTEGQEPMNGRVPDATHVVEEGGAVGSGGAAEGVVDGGNGVRSGDLGGGG